MLKRFLNVVDRTIGNSGTCYLNVLKGDRETTPCRVVALTILPGWLPLMHRSLPEPVRRDV